MLINRVHTPAARVGARINALLLCWIERIVEQRMRKARFEAEMYGGKQKHSSKNDDDLPIVR